MKPGAQFEFVDPQLVRHAVEIIRPADLPAFFLCRRVSDGTLLLLHRAELESDATAPSHAHFSLNAS